MPNNRKQLGCTYILYQQHMHAARTQAMLIFRSAPSRQQFPEFEPFFFFRGSDFEGKKWHTSLQSSISIFASHFHQLQAFAQATGKFEPMQLKRDLGANCVILVMETMSRKHAIHDITNLIPLGALLVCSITLLENRIPSTQILAASDAST